MKAYVTVNRCIKNIGLNAYDMTSDHCVEKPFPFFFNNKELAWKYARSRVTTYCDPNYIRNYDYVVECNLEGDTPADIPVCGYLVTSVDYDVDDSLAVVASAKTGLKIFKEYAIGEDSAVSVVQEIIYQQARSLGLGKNAVSPLIHRIEDNCSVEYIRDPQGRIVKAWFIHPVLPYSNKLDLFDIH